ncbi:hypothetical protein Celaphus_00019026 [Cervus elaphus hippelaphus]|uniref:Uncharacterized protein n=1 Tax=Cervus elaphus hippelaphus TaxID=46360 RepID=A0A212C7P9_CEREH|nr:hypothetical protein Celaphus_00019026 [Cervus elaphus hippelaphus]
MQRLMIFCRKTAEKKNLFHFQFPSLRFPHGCDVRSSFRNAQRRDRGFGSLGLVSRDWKVPGWKSPMSAGGKTEREKRELAVCSLRGGQVRRARRPWGRSGESSRREDCSGSSKGDPHPPDGPPENSPEPGVHGEPSPPGPNPNCDPSLRRTLVLTWT